MNWTAGEEEEAYENIRKGKGGKEDGAKGEARKRWVGLWAMLGLGFLVRFLILFNLV